MKKRILFVDDEKRILDGTRRVLRPMHKEWDLHFTSSAQEALARMHAGETFDVVVSDIRMPGMDGADFLQHVQKEFPDCVRVVLSGHADKTAILRLTGCAHQYLSKPCTGRELKAVITRACQMSDLLGNKSLRELVSRVEALPSLPSLHTALIEELKQPDSSLSKVEEIISQDMGMSSKVLQLVNSTFFGRARRISSVGQAVSLLGTDTIHGLVYSMHLFSQFDLPESPGFTMEELWDHCSQVGLFARQIARAENQAEQLVDDCCIAGLLHDIGILVLASQAAATYRKVIERAGEQNCDVILAEREILGATHAEVGAYLMGLWGLPEAIVDALLYHHAPDKSDSEGFTPLTAVHVANVFAHHEYNWISNGMGAPISKTYLEKAKMLNHVKKWKEKCDLSEERTSRNESKSSVRR